MRVAIVTAEFKHRAAVERGKRLAIELEGNGEDAAFRPEGVVDPALFLETARVFEDGEVKLDSLFGVRVEPEKRRYAGKVLESAHCHLLILRTSSRSPLTVVTGGHTHIVNTGNLHRAREMDNIPSVLKKFTPKRRSRRPVTVSLDIFSDRGPTLIIRDLRLRGYRTFRKFQSPKGRT